MRWSCQVLRDSHTCNSPKSATLLNFRMCAHLPLSGGRTLQILKAKVSDGGKYSCVAMNAAGEAHKHIHLTVFSESALTRDRQVKTWPVKFTLRLRRFFQSLQVSGTAAATPPWWSTSSWGNPSLWSASPTPCRRRPSPGTRMAGWWQSRPICASWRKDGCCRSGNRR